MSRRRGFRPAAEGLEGRWLPSGGQGVVATPGPESTTPAIGRQYEPAPGGWLGLHAQYVQEAVAGGDQVVFLGDSITYLWGLSGAAVWQSTFGGMRAAHFGIPGDLTQNLLWRVENGELAGRPSVAVVLIGINNLGTGESPAETSAGVAAVVGAIRAESPGTKVLLLGLFPAHASAADPIRAEIAQVNATIAHLDNGRDVRFLNFSDQFLAPDGTLPTWMMPDGIHPTASGFAIWADAIAGPLAALLADSPGAISSGPTTPAAPAAPAKAGSVTTSAPKTLPTSALAAETPLSEAASAVTSDAVTWIAPLDPPPTPEAPEPPARPRSTSPAVPELALDD